LTVYDVLAKPIKSYSRILDKEMYVYWDTIEALDSDSPKAYAQLLRENGLLRTSVDSEDTSFYDEAAKRRVTSFGDTYNKVFDFKVSHKLVQGDLVIHNNLTYAHSVSNWTPSSGIRNTVVAFA